MCPSLHIWKQLYSSEFTHIFWCFNKIFNTTYRWYPSWHISLWQPVFHHGNSYFTMVTLLLIHCFFDSRHVLLSASWQAAWRSSWVILSAPWCCAGLIVSSDATQTVIDRQKLVLSTTTPKMKEIVNCGEVEGFNMRRTQWYWDLQSDSTLKR